MRAVTVGVLLVSLVVGALLGITVVQFLSAQHRVEKELNPARVELSTILALYIDQETAERGYILTGRPEFLAPYEDAAPQIVAIRAKLDGQVSARVRDRLEAMDEVHRRWLALAAEPELAAARSGDRSRAEELVVSGDGRRLFDQVRAAHESADEAIAAEQHDATQRADSLLRRLSWLLGFTIVAFLTTTLVGAGAFSRRVLRPLAELGRSSRAVASGDLRRAVRGDGPREVTEVADDVDTMRRHLLDELDASRRASEALVLGQPAVQAVQEALSRLRTTVPGLEVSAQIESAEGVLAGDFLDVLELDDGRVAVVLGDVSGHGPEAAVVGLRIKTAVAAMLRRLPVPDVLTTVQHGLATEPEVFATVFVAVVDAAADQVSWVNAGHPPPLLLSAGPDEPAIELEPTGPLVSGALPGTTWRVETRPFRSGDRLVAFSDGLLEARDEAGTEFGSGGLAAVLAMSSHGSPGDVVTRMRTAVRDHAARPRDDVTILVIRRT